MNAIRNKLYIVCVVALIGGLSSFTACTDAERAKFGGLGSEHSVSCYSGGKLIYEGISTGKVLSEENSDGYYFTDNSSGKLMEVSGNCVITRH